MITSGTAINMMVKTPTTVKINGVISCRYPSITKAKRVTRAKAI
jgi:hypothetical protein